jgi:hypothetical protein
MNTSTDVTLENTTIENGRVDFSSIVDVPFTPNLLTLNEVTFNNSNVWITKTRSDITNTIFVDTTLNLSFRTSPTLPNDSTAYTYGEQDRILDFITYSYSSLVSASGFDFNPTINCKFSEGVIKVRNSIVVGPPENRSAIESDCVFENSLVPPNLMGTNNFFEEPGFVDSAGGDFKLLDTSPAKDRLRGSFDIETDFEGDLRPFGEGYDVGADEYTP